MFVPLDIVRGCLKSDELTVVYLTLWLKSSSKGVLEGISKKQLGCILGFHEDRVSKNLRALNEIGLVITKRQGRKGNKYTLPQKTIFEPDPGNYTIIRREIFLNAKVPWQARLLHVTLSSFSYGRKPAKLHFKFISSITTWSHRTISRYLLVLRKLGLVNVVRRKYLSSLYFVTTEMKRYEFSPARKNKKNPQKTKVNTKISPRTETRTVYREVQVPTLNELYKRWVEPDERCMQ